MKKIFSSLLLFTFLCSALELPAYASLNPERTVVVIKDPIHNVGEQGSKSKPTSSGGIGGTQMKDVASVKVCGKDISKNTSIVKNLQQNGYGNISVKLKKTDLDSLTDAFGKESAQKIMSALDKGKVVTAGSQSLVTAYPTICGQRIEFVSYDLVRSDFAYVEIKLEIDQLWNKDPVTNKYINVGSDYTRSVCYPNTDGSNKMPFSQQSSTTNNDASSKNKNSKVTSTSHYYTSTSVNYKKPYKFNCSGKYKATFIEHYKDGTTKTKGPEYYDVYLDVIKDNDGDKTTGSNGLVINQ